MKNLVIVFITTLMVQNICAQDWSEIIQDSVYKFEEAEPLKDRANQIIVKTIQGSDVTTSSGLKVGKSYYLFEVVKSKDPSLTGKPVACRVMLSRKSNLSGSEGRLVLRPLYIKNGYEQIPLMPNDIYRRGLNRTNIKFWVIPTIVSMFLAGSGAEILPDEEIVMTLAK